MIYDNFLIDSFEPLYLTVDKIGPFQEKVWTFDFTDTNNEPCNFYFFISENGRGKTTLLELMVALMRMLGHREMDTFEYEGLDKGEGRVQWDIRLRLKREGRSESVVFSLIAGFIGADTSLKAWGTDELEEVGAESWHRFGFRKRKSGRLELVGKSDELAKDFIDAIQNFSGDRPQGFEDDPMTFPTLLYFSAYRDILPIQDKRSISAPEEWGYKTVHSFTQEGVRWLKSLDNLLVWLTWLDDGRFERAKDIINERVFKGTLKYLKKVRKDPPGAIIENEGKEHRLDQLSSGEKCLVQMFLRIGAHMTRNTILLIDEMDVHLHTKWQHRLLNQLKQMAKEHPGLTIIVSTHSREILERFHYDMEEENLRKGGHIIEDDDIKSG
ncbi:MAG: ATP-binding protein [Desulfobacteraceae bacterium]|nr:ATP-binding protein [Desulfobacteraceae bacterium]